MKRNRRILVLALLPAVLGGCAEFRGAQRDVGQAGREVGHATRDATRDVGRGVGDVARDVGRSAKDVAKDVGKATREAARTVRKELATEK